MTLSISLMAAGILLCIVGLVIWAMNVKKNFFSEQTSFFTTGDAQTAARSYLNALIITGILNVIGLFSFIIGLILMILNFVK